MKPTPVTPAIPRGTQTLVLRPPHPSHTQTNPYVVAIVPEPVDYFRACGLTSVCRSRCRAEIEAFEAANANPTSIYQEYTTRSNSPFFIDLDEGAVTPMTIIATTELTDCEHVCGQRLDTEREASPDRCVAIAGVVGDSDLTVMTYCVPSLPGSGVRRHDTWSARGTLPIMNSVVEAYFLDFERGESVALLRDMEVTAGEFRSRIDVLRRGGPTFINGVTQPIVGSATLKNAIGISEPRSTVRVNKISGILVQPGSPYPILHAEVVASVVRNIPALEDFTDGDQEQASTERYNLCGLIAGATWHPQRCDYDIWDEADRGHIIWTNDASDRVAVVPSGSLLATGGGDVRVLDMPPGGWGGLSLVASVPFQSTTWSLTSGIPATTRALDFSYTTKALVRKTPRVSQAGTFSASGGRMEVFMTNSPGSPTHWLSQVGGALYMFCPPPLALVGPTSVNPSASLQLNANMLGGEISVVMMTLGVSK